MALATPFVTQESLDRPYSRISVLKCPMTYKQKANRADRAGVENVENSRAIAITSMSSIRIRTPAKRICTSETWKECRRYRIAAYTPRIITHTLTANVMLRPRYFPRINSWRATGFESKL